MGKYYKGIILAICFMFATSAYAVSPAILQGMSGGGAGGTCDTSNIVWWWRAEALDFTATNNAEDYSAGDPSPFENYAAKDASAAKYGEYGLDTNAPYEFVGYETPSATLDDHGKIGFWMRINTFAADFFPVEPYISNEDNFKLRFSGTDEFEFYWKDASVERNPFITTTANLETGVWYWVEFAWNTSTDYREIFLYEDEVGGSLGTSSETINSFVGAVTSLYFGELANSAADVHIDNVIISTDETVDLFTVCKDELEWPE